MQSTVPHTLPGPRGVSRDVAAGLFLLLLAAGAYVACSDLAIQEAGAVGPGLMPKGVALLTAGFGLLILVVGLLSGGGRLEAIALRGPIFVLGAVAVFAATIRPLGLAVAGPLAMIIAACADRDVRIVEIAVFAAVMSGLCIGLFKYLLQLPIPLAPMLLGY
jgi:putative tricarboxylic transport membrane protein